MSKIPKHSFEFQEWIDDGNVIKFDDGYGTQDALYKNISHYHTKALISP